MSATVEMTTARRARSSPTTMALVVLIIALLVALALSLTTRPDPPQDFNGTVGVISADRTKVSIQVGGDQLNGLLAHAGRPLVVGQTVSGYSVEDDRGTVIFVK